MKLSKLLNGPRTTGIGSLPHHNTDSAMEFAFGVEIPFLPEIPIRNPYEYMIPRALEGLPGLSVDRDGLAILDPEMWDRLSPAFDRRMASAFASGSSRDAFAAFEPSAAASSCWQPFLWELAERGCRIAKIQLAGPLTSQWVLRLKEGGPAADTAVGAQIVRLVLARAVAMVRRLRDLQVEPIFFLDEPGLFGLNRENPRHVMAIQELKLLVLSLKKEGVIVGLHCCSDTDWGTVLALGLDVLSIDVELSLGALLGVPSSRTFVERGGVFSFGVIPNTWTGERLRAARAEDCLAPILDRFAEHWPDARELGSRAVMTGLYTPACGLAMHSTTDAEAVLALLADARQWLVAR